MALRVDYVIRETGTNLRRNVTLTIATVVTVALTLTFVGAFFLAKKGLDRSNVQFKGSVSFIIFMNPDATQPQIDSVGNVLESTPQVKSTKFLDHAAALVEFKEVFADKPELTRNITAADLPTNYKVFLNDGSSDVVLSLVEQFRGEPGVLEVKAAAEQIKQNETAFNKIGTFLLIGSLIVGASSLVLIVNSIRIAMFARRREIEVMKLVGATNWFIRIPFMFEGMIQGIVGSLVGVAFIVSIKGQILPLLVKAGGIFTDFRLESSDVFSVSVGLVVAGALIGIATSALAATRYLDV
ncbi:MAG: cell division protein FtsX [Acidimicrobiales bacterium]